MIKISKNNAIHQMLLPQHCQGSKGLDQMTKGPLQQLEIPLIVEGGFFASLHMYTNRQQIHLTRKKGQSTCLMTNPAPDLTDTLTHVPHKAVADISKLGNLWER